MQESTHHHPDIEKRLVSIENDIRLAKLGLLVIRWSIGLAIATAIIAAVQRLLE
jgi:hypothetical protein